MDFTIALAQTDSKLGDFSANVDTHVSYAEKARDGGAQLVVFPELSLTGYTVRDTNWELALRLPAKEKLQGLLKLSHDITILAGGIEESSEFGIFNSAFLFEHGKVRSVHRKTYPPTYGMFEELRYFSRGNTMRAFDSRVGRIGVLICEDLWHVPLPYILAQDGASVIIGIAASPTRLSGTEERAEIAQVNTEHHRSYARLLSCYVVFCNRVGFEDGINFWGGSEIVGPSGEILVQAKLYEEDLIFTDIQENELRRARRSSRHFLDDDPRVVIEELTRIYKAK